MYSSMHFAKAQDVDPEQDTLIEQSMTLIKQSHAVIEKQCSKLYNYVAINKDYYVLYQ